MKIKKLELHGMLKGKNGILRIIQSIPSKKAEPFKLWLAKVGKDRLEEIAGNARKELESKLGRSVISSSNATTPDLLDDSKK